MLFRLGKASRRRDSFASKITASRYDSRSWRIVRHLNSSFPRVYFLLSLIPRISASYRWLRVVENENLGRRLSALRVSSFKTSDTIFICGTGATINEYPQQWWREVQQHDSIGLNYFALHEHVPTLAITEDTDEYMRSVLKTRYVERRDYLNVPLILKTQLANLSPSRIRSRVRTIRAFPSTVHENTYFPIEFLAAGGDVRSMKDSYRISRAVGMWRPREQFILLTKRRGTLSFAINLAVRSGYRRIVLCGIDLNHNEYFYESRGQEIEASGFTLPPKEEHGPIHRTNDPSHHPVTMHDVVLGINETILERMGIEILVGSSKSALHPDLPLYAWESGD